MSELLPSFERNCRQSLVTTESSGPFNLQLLVRFNSKSILILHFYRYWGSCFYIKRVGNCCSRGLLLFFIKKLQHHALLLADTASRASISWYFEGLYCTYSYFDYETHLYFRLWLEISIVFLLQRLWDSSTGLNLSLMVEYTNRFLSAFSTAVRMASRAAYRGVNNLRFILPRGKSQRGVDFPRWTSYWFRHSRGFNFLAVYITPRF